MMPERRIKLLCAGVWIGQRSEIYKRSQVVGLCENLIHTGQVAGDVSLIGDVVNQVLRPVQNNCEGEFTVKRGWLSRQIAGSCSDSQPARLFAVISQQ